MLICFIVTSHVRMISVVCHLYCVRSAYCWLFTSIFCNPKLHKILSSLSLLRPLSSWNTRYVYLNLQSDFIKSKWMQIVYRDNKMLVFSSVWLKNIGEIHVDLKNKGRIKHVWQFLIIIFIVSLKHARRILICFVLAPHISMILAAPFVVCWFGQCKCSQNVMFAVYQELGLLKTFLKRFVRCGVYTGVLFSLEFMVTLEPQDLCMGTCLFWTSSLLLQILLLQLLLVPYCTA